jgi:hypothetical protein
VCRQVERIAVGQQSGQPLRNSCAVGVGNADVKLGDFDEFLRFHGTSPSLCVAFNE